MSLKFSNLMKQETKNLLFITSEKTLILLIHLLFCCFLGTNINRTHVEPQFFS